MVGDIGARRLVGWLLRTNRRLTGANSALRSAKEFARLFRVTGEPSLAPSQVTRWELGEIVASRPAIRRYEYLLGLEPDSLVTISDALHRAERACGLTSHADAAVDEDRLFDLLRHADGGGALSGLEWMALADNVRAAPGLMVFPEIWHRVAGRLLTELVVSDQREWLLRQEAMSRLLEHPHAGRYAVRECIELAADPSTPAVLEPMSLLDVTALPAANAYVLAQLADPSEEGLLRAAAATVRSKIARGHFSGVEREMVARCVLARAGDGLDAAFMSELRGLVTAVPPIADARLATMHEASRRVGLRAQSGFDVGDDDLLPHVIEQALFSPSLEGQLYAAMCLGATPYKAAVGEALVAEIRADLARRGDPHTAIAALRTLTRMNVDLHRPLLYQILTSPGACSIALREAAAWALPHCAGRFPAATWTDLLARYTGACRAMPTAGVTRILHGIAYGVGTDGYRRLSESIGADPAMPPDVRKTAAWLLRSRSSDTWQQG